MKYTCRVGTGIGFIKSHNIICFFYFRVEIVTVSYIIGVVLRVSYLCEVLLIVEDLSLEDGKGGRHQLGGWRG